MEAISQDEDDLPTQLHLVVVWFWICTICVMGMHMRERKKAYYMREGSLC